MSDFTRAVLLTPDVEAVIEDAFEYHPWDEHQQLAGIKVRKILSEAMKVIVTNVPPSPDRTTAMRKLREARMDCNSAITHSGKY